MLKAMRLTYILLLIAPLVSLTSCKGEEQPAVFFSGAGMKTPATEAIRDFTAKTGIPVDVHFDGSAVLRQHIETYGDVDVFLSGDKKNMDILVAKGLVEESAFVAWHIPSILIPPEKKDKIRGLNDLARADVRFVMSNPEQASLGKMVFAVLKRHPRAEAILKNVAVYGSDTQDDLRRFWDLYKNGRADAVIEWDIMVHTPEGKGLMVVPFEKEYEIRDSIVLGLLKGAKNPKRARRFYDFFRTEGLKAFKEHGYDTGDR